MPHLIALVTLLLFSSLSLAAEPQCFQASPAKKSNALSSAAQSATLSPQQYTQIQKHLDQLARRKHDGDSIGFYCKQKEGRIDEEYDIEFRPQKVTDNSYMFRVKLIADKRGHNNERLRYTLGANKLFLGPNERGTEVIILALDNHQLKTMEQYRQRNPNGSSIVRETIRHYQFQGKRLIVDNHYYISGALQSVNQWQFR